jgi:hypothetical protein
VAVKVPLRLMVELTEVVAAERCGRAKVSVTAETNARRRTGVMVTPLRPSRTVGSYGQLIFGKMDDSS